MTKEYRADDPVYSLTREQAHLVMCLIELVEGKDAYISELHEKLGITGREGYSEKDSEALEKADKHDQIRRYTERWTLHNELQIATMGVPSFPRRGLVVVEKSNNQNPAPDPLVSHLGQWVSIKDRLPEIEFPDD